MVTPCPLLQLRAGKDERAELSYTKPGEPPVAHDLFCADIA